MIKHYKPGDPEFDIIAKEILHISRVRNHSCKPLYIDAEASSSKMAKKRRGENLDQIR